MVHRVLRCDCGFEAAGASDDELVDAAQLHARDSHATEVAAELVLALARPQPSAAHVTPKETEQ